MVWCLPIDSPVTCDSEFWVLDELASAPRSEMMDHSRTDHQTPSLYSHGGSLLEAWRSMTVWVTCGHVVYCPRSLKFGRKPSRFVTPWMRQHWLVVRASSFVRRVQSAMSSRYLAWPPLMVGTYFKSVSQGVGPAGLVKRVAHGCA